MNLTPKSSAVLFSAALMLALPLTSAFAVNPNSGAGKPDGGNPPAAKKPVRLSNIFSVTPETTYLSSSGTPAKVAVVIGVTGDADADISCPATLKIVSKETGATLKNDQFNIGAGTTPGATLKRSYDIVFPAVGNYDVNFSMPVSPLCQGGNRSSNIKVQGDGGHLRAAFYQNHTITVIRNTPGKCSLLRLSRMDNTGKVWSSRDFTNLEFKPFEDYSAYNAKGDAGQLYLNRETLDSVPPSNAPEGTKTHWEVRGLSADCWGWHAAQY